MRPTWFMAARKNGIIVNGLHYESLRALSKASGVPPSTIRNRLQRGLSPEEAVSPTSLQSVPLDVNGRTFPSIAAASKEYEISYTTLRRRMNQKRSSEELFSRGRVKQNKDPGKRTNGNWSPTTVLGITYPSKKAAANAHGVQPYLFCNRLSKGLTPEQALGIEPFPGWFVPGKGQFAARRSSERRRKERDTGLRRCSCCKEDRPLETFFGLKSKSTRCDECVLRAWLEYRYGISAEHFHEMARRQGNSCAVCGKHLNISTATVRRSHHVAVDHCHASGRVRGILCSSCNTGIGLLKDSPSIIRSAARYLESNSGCPDASERGPLAPDSKMTEHDTK